MKCLFFCPLSGEEKGRLCRDKYDQLRIVERKRSEKNRWALRRRSGPDEKRGQERPLRVDREHALC